MNQAMFEVIYRTDLVYLPGCWKLCGAHCCGFAQRKPLLRLFGSQMATELYLLPGEYDFLERKGFLNQFGDHKHRVVEYELDRTTLKLESIVGTEPACICGHETRTTVCRLYPLLPVFDLGGNLVGTERAHLFDELELLDGLESPCRVTSLPFAELSKFLTLTTALSTCPVTLFHLEAFRIAKRHVVERLRHQVQQSGTSAFRQFEMAFIRKNLFDHQELKTILNRLYAAFESRYGDRLSNGAAGADG